jgi:hypothetical protein
MKLKARPYLHYAPVPGGVFFSAAHEQLVLRGSDLLFGVADRCVPLLESGATEDELVGALGTERARPLVRHLLDELSERGLLLDARRFTVAEPAPEVRAQYPGSLAYLESVCDDPYAAFAAVRNAKVALYGPAAVVDPAVRGLIRAGVGKVVVVGEPTGDCTAYADVDAVIRVGDRGHGPRSVPDGAFLVPVELDDRVLLAGPGIRAGDEQPGWSAFGQRARRWADADGIGPAARPVADALIGALAAQLVFRTLAGLAPAGTAHVVYGTELVAEEVTLGPADSTVDGPQSLADVAREPMPEPEEAIASAAALVARWTGLFARGGTEEDLPQLPLSLREVSYRAHGTGSVFGWGVDQQGATVGIALEALRRTVAGPGAAGLTAEHWLLDGALRLLAAGARPLREVSEVDMGAETARVWRVLAGQDAGPCTVRVLHVPALDWRLARVEVAGSTVAQAWGPDADTAVREAVGTTLAGLQVAPFRTGGPDAPAPRTDALLFAADPTLALLRKQVEGVAATTGVTFRGRSRRRDPVLGDIAYWYGPVEAAPLGEEATR